MTVISIPLLLRLSITAACYWQDLTYCYQHMSENDLQTLDTLDTTEYIDGHLSDEGNLLKELCLSL